MPGISSKNGALSNGKHLPWLWSKLYVTIHSVGKAISINLGVEFDINLHQRPDYMKKYKKISNTEDSFDMAEVQTLSHFLHLPVHTEGSANRRFPPLCWLPKKTTVTFDWNISE